MLVKTLRTLIAERLDDYGAEIEEWIRPELVEVMATTTRDWLAQPGTLALIYSYAIPGSTRNVQRELVREAVR